MARRIKQAHMQFLLDLHYSDFWADPGHQDTPAAWQGQDLATLAATVHDYTRSVVATLVRQGTPPQIIQIGNEVTAGMLWPQGQLYVGSDQRWVEFTTLLKAGIAGARVGAPRGRRPAIMLHIDRGGDQGGAQWFYDHMRDYAVDFDQIGLSYYPYWHGSLSDLRRNLDNLAVRYGKPIVVVETAYAWTFDDHDGYPNIVGPSFNLPPEYPATPEGQALFIRDLLSVVARTPDKLGRGIVYWEPAWIPGVGWKPGEGNAWDNQTLFDAQGHSLESIDAMRP
jgi:arabinogalactan endo-1,4-beta-galactosidase